MSPVVILGSLMIVGAVYLVWWSISGESETVGSDRLGTDGAPDMRQLALSKSASERTLQPFIDHLGERLRRFTPRGRLSSLELKIARAGNPPGWTVNRLVAAKVSASLLLGGLLLTKFLTDPGFLVFVFMLLFFAFGYIIPDGIIDRRGSERILAIQRDLSDTIDQLTMMVQAGLGLDAAIARLARSGTGALAEEFSKVIRDMRVGASRGVALNNLASRVDIPELRSFVAALAQADLLGIAVSETLEIQASEARAKRRQTAEEEAMKLPVKILFPMVVCNFPVLFIVLIGPNLLRISDTF